MSIPSNIERQPRGRPNGGEFAETTKPASGLHLVPAPAEQFHLSAVVDDHQPEQQAPSYGPKTLACSCGEWSSPTHDTSADAYYHFTIHLGTEVASRLGVTDVDVPDAGHVDHQLRQQDPREAA